MPDRRLLLLRALLLDCLGQFIFLGFLAVLPDITGLSISDVGLSGQLGWLFFIVILYPTLGWLFGSFTVLHWRRLPLLVLLQRLFLTAVVTLIIVAIARWLFNPAIDVWLVHRRVQILWIVGVTAWALLVRVGLRRGVFSKELPRLLLLAESDEVQSIKRAWKRVPGCQSLRSIRPDVLLERMKCSQESLLVAITPSFRLNPEISPLLERFEIGDHRQLRLVSLIRFFEQQQERLPPLFISEESLAFNDLPWVDPFSVQVQLKRLADVLLSGILLLVTIPFILSASFFIWLEDQGPIFIPNSAAVGWVNLSRY